MCRASKSFCDEPETCTGESEFCPDNLFKPNGEKCTTHDGSEAYCYDGACASHSSQCKVLWGPSGQKSEQCFSKNINGSRHGNCGFEKVRQEYIKCNAEDVQCGILQCSHVNERLEYGMETVAILSHSFINQNRTIISCRSAIIDLGLDTVDPGLVPNGAKCGDNKMCVNQKCVDVV